MGCSRSSSAAESSNRASSGKRLGSGFTNGRSRELIPVSEGRFASRRRRSLSLWPSQPVSCCLQSEAALSVIARGGERSAVSNGRAPTRRAASDESATPPPALLTTRRLMGWCNALELLKKEQLALRSPLARHAYKPNR